MQTELKKSKNYFIVRIPNSIAENWNLNNNTKIDIKMQKGKIILTKKILPNFKRRKRSDRFERSYKKRIRSLQDL